MFFALGAKAQMVTVLTEDSTTAMVNINDIRLLSTTASGVRAAFTGPFKYRSYLTSLDDIASQVEGQLLVFTDQSDSVRKAIPTYHVDWIEAASDTTTRIRSNFFGGTYIATEAFSTFQVYPYAGTFASLFDNGSVSDTTSATGKEVVQHNLNLADYDVYVTVVDTAGTYWLLPRVEAKGDSSFTVGFYNITGDSSANLTPVSFDWIIKQ